MGGFRALQAYTPVVFEAGNRQLNAALYIAAVCQVRYGGEGGDYYRRKLAEGKSRGRR